ncbi:MAG: hypothetical protein ABC585_07005 [Candidatus Methanosuratincola petrocarbonis]|nr:hypothetical protein [Candidatus Methanosuratincola sp.]
MTTSFSVNSPRCDQRTQIVAEKEGSAIKIRLNTTCPRVKAYGDSLGEISINDLAQPILKNPIYVIASSKLGPECVVPCAVVSAAWTEAGMVARSILNRFPSTCFTYEGSSDTKL